MAASCTFGISFTIGAGNDDFVDDPSPVASPTQNLIQYEDGLCPYSDEKEVVVDDSNYADRSVWRTTTTTEDLLPNEDSSSSTVASDSRVLNDQQLTTDTQPKSGMLHCTRAWRMTKTAVKNASSSTSKYLTASTPHQSNDGYGEFGLSVISRAEFEKLPLTIQRKVSALLFYCLVFLLFGACACFKAFNSCPSTLPARSQVYRLPRQSETKQGSKPCGRDNAATTANPHKGANSRPRVGLQSQSWSLVAIETYPEDGRLP
jgi:hypothetical protein